MRSSAILESQEANPVAVSVAPVPTPDVGVDVVHFSGTVERATEDALGDGVVLHLRSHPRLPAAMVHVRRGGFRHAELDEHDPQTLSIWNRGIRLTLELFGGPPTREASEDDTPSSPSVDRTGCQLNNRLT